MTKAAIILLQIFVSLLAFSYTLTIYYQMRVELKKKQKNLKEVKNNIKNKQIEINGKSNHRFDQQIIDNHNNNPDFDEIKDIKDLNGIIV